MARSTCTASMTAVTSSGTAQGFATSELTMVATRPTALPASPMNGFAAGIWDNTTNTGATVAATVTRMTNSSAVAKGAEV